VAGRRGSPHGDSRSWEVAPAADPGMPDRAGPMTAATPAAPRGVADPLARPRSAADPAVDPRVAARVAALPKAGAAPESAAMQAGQGPRAPLRPNPLVTPCSFPHPVRRRPGAAPQLPRGARNVRRGTSL
jgi:hypothetical protein